MERDWELYCDGNRPAQYYKPPSPIAQLATAFKYISVAIIRKRAEVVTNNIGSYPVPWLTPSEVLDLIDMFLR